MDSNNNQDANDDLIAPIPKKKRPTPDPSAPAAPFMDNGDFSFGTIPKKSSAVARRPSSTADPDGRQRPSYNYDDSDMPIPKKKSSKRPSLGTGDVPQQQRRSSFGHDDPFQRRNSTPSSSSLMKKKEKKKMSASSSYYEPQEQLFDTFGALPTAPRSKIVKVISESPLVLRIKVDPSLFAHRGSKRDRLKATNRPSYQEADLTDSDDFMTDEEEIRPKKKGRLKPFGAKSKSKTEAPEDTIIQQPAFEEVPVIPMEETIIPPDGITPPEGHLHTLWYSREIFANLFVLEKPLGFKTRPVVQLIKTAAAAAVKTEVTSGASSDEPSKKPGENLGQIEVADQKDKVTPIQAVLDQNKSSQPEPYELDLLQASKIQQVLLQNEAFWRSIDGRMEVSRLNPQRCPVVLMAAAIQEQHKAKLENRQPAFRLAPVDANQQEELLLSKWRGRSHLHCSWERPIDIQKADTSNNSMARNKIRRFFQAQEVALGPRWKDHFRMKDSVLEVVNGEDVEREDYFSPQCLEVERILSCDENEMDPTVLPKQRGRNMQSEQEELLVRETANHQESDKDTSHPVSNPASIDDEDVLTLICTFYKGISELLARPRVKSVIVSPPGDEAWDPEDNVRYVVKWKGAPPAEITWEYWRDIKRDAVVQAEDYWHRQIPPADYQNKAHPHMRDFKKLQESPSFGLSSRERKCIGFADSEKEEDEFKGFKLRSYQLEGVNWLVFNWWNKRSCILADEMGLGKTIQSTAFLRELQSNDNTQIRGPFLIVAPLSLAGQWQSELASWAPDMNVLLYHGSEKARDFLVKEEFYFKEPFATKGAVKGMKKQSVTKFHVLITTYEVVLKDAAVLSKIRWKVLIVDEAHRLKNHTSRLFSELGAVKRDHCVLLTGTPIANATEELWALLHFSNPNVFDDRDDFLHKFGEMTDAKQVNDLHTLLRPYLLRRVKEDVEKSLPPKEETVLEVSLTPIQKAFYKAIYERNTAFLFKGAKANNTPSLMNVMMELRKCCNHPFLIKGAEERILNDAATKMQEKDGAAADFSKLFGDQLVKSSGKMVLIAKLLQKLFDGGHKVLIFSQMVRVLDLLEEFLRIQQYKYERLDGSTSSSSRSAAVERFTKKSFGRFVMLLSTRAGGLGLNLTAADTVIIFDSDWNPQNDLQAMARAHRIGQERRVLIYRLLTAKTYEMHMFHSASLKLGLERAVLSQNREQNDESDDKSKRTRDREAQAKEIDQLLKKGAYDIFKDEDDGEAEKFMETDIDQLLEMSSKKVTYGAASTSSLGSGLGSFSKASFVAETDDGAKDVDLDDPDFWSKAVGLETPVETPEEIAAMIDDGVKRSRKQVQQYDPYADTAAAEKLKQEQLELEKMLEREEKERQRQEKRAKKDATREKKKKERDGQQKASDTASLSVLSEKGKVAVESGSSLQPEMRIIVKKSKKNDRQRAARRAENENPIIEQLKQAWEVSQRNRASAAILRFGFGRFCKVRHECNLNSLPLQDLEIFTRSYHYQIALQVGVVLMGLLQKNAIDDSKMRATVCDWLGTTCTSNELEFIFESLETVLESQKEVDRGSRVLRMPAVLAEPAFVLDLRKGAGFRALRRIGVLARLRRFMEHFLDQILSNLGHEELGKRGCAYGDLSCLDVDLKARLVTTEELILAIGTSFRQLSTAKPPALWWDRECDVSLLLGTFVHGLGNYKAMGLDPSLCFLGKKKELSERYLACKAAVGNFGAACRAARKVFDDALEAGRIKAELEVQAAVAAAAKAAKKREEDAALLREGGEGIEDAIRNMPETQVENAFEFDGTDSHFVTLQRMQKGVKTAVSIPRSLTSEEDLDDLMEVHEDETHGGGRGRHPEYLPMPDARVLDHRLLQLMAEIDNTQIENGNDNSSSIWVGKDDVIATTGVRKHIFERPIGMNYQSWTDEFSGVGLGSYQSGTTHRSLNDGSDFGHGSATPMLAQIAYGTDAPRYLRQIGVPMNLTRYAVSSLVHADPNSIEEMLKGEFLKFYGNEQGIPETPVESKPVDGDAKQPTAETDTANGVSSETQKKDDDEATKVEDALPDKAENDADQPPASKPTESQNGNSSKEGEAGSSALDSGPKMHLEKKLALIPSEFRDSARLRAVVCLAVLLSGFPPADATGDVHESLLMAFDANHMHEDDQFLTRKRFQKVITSLSIDVDIDLPPDSIVNEYVDKILIPHCLQLCVYGNGPQISDARGSEGKYMTALGYNVHPEPSDARSSPLPDPTLSLQEHSTEAVCHASAILRRVRLLRACQFVSSCCEVSAQEVQSLAKLKSMCPSQEGLPIWWCPWVHDVALVANAARKGLFAIIRERDQHPVFAPSVVEEFLRSSLAGRGGMLPGSDYASSEKVDEWIKQESMKFPCMNQIERRLSFLCDGVTSKAADTSDRYCSLPMFDHGGWPRN